MLLRCLAGLCLAASLHAAQASSDPDRIVFPARVSQGAMVLGKVPPGSQVDYGKRRLQVTAFGTVGFGVGRDEEGPLTLEVLARMAARNRFMSKSQTPMAHRACQWGTAKSRGAAAGNRRTHSPRAGRRGRRSRGG